MLSREQLERYARHILLKDVGGQGQARLLAARVLVVGAGGLGSPLALYLAAAGIGTIGLVDDDVVALSNLQRQILHDMAGIGRRKTASGAARIAALNPDVRVIAHDERLTAANVAGLVGGYDLVADGSDNFATRFLLNDACYRAGRTLVSAAIQQFDGQLSTFKPHQGADLPCYRCLHPEQPPEELDAACVEAGVLGALAGVMGSLQATEILKEVLQVGTGLAGRLLLYDAMNAEFRTIRLRRNPACPLCGTA
ncbi:MAG: molybdopterin-synthase adenylyltransferase MoeB [Sneathiellaceae bacterium]